jgi:outer membrane lipoprotein SlyB
MKSRFSIFTLGAGILVCAPGIALSDTTAIAINYGTVESVRTVEQKGKHAGGALAGGLLGAALAGPRHRILKIGATTAAGAAIQGAATSGTSQLYTVRLIGGGQASITTEQVDIREGDCVSVESGDYANIRRVSSIHCEAKSKSNPPEHHVTGASDCQSAKNELTKAQTDDAVELAVKKVRVLCED